MVNKDLYIAAEQIYSGIKINMWTELCAPQIYFLSSTSEANRQWCNTKRCKDEINMALRQRQDCWSHGDGHVTYRKRRETRCGVGAANCRRERRSKLMRVDER